MRKMTMPNFCINFLNKAEKSLPILYDFAVASLADAWIKISYIMKSAALFESHPSRMRGLKWQEREKKLEEKGCIPRGCVD